MMTNLSPLDRATLSLSYGDYLRFSQLMQDRFGLAFPEKRRTELEIGVRRAFAASTCPDLDSYFKVLLDPMQGVTEMERLVNYLTIGETHFFRDAGQFDALISTVLPDLIERRRASRTLRIWSAGCASGEEPYSIAMLLRDLLPDIDTWNITILGTDINTQHLERAHRGLYGEWAFRETRAKILRSAYFTQRGNQYELSPVIRKMVHFSLLNLAEDRYPSYETNTMFMDLVLCRNVTIYFPEAVTRVIVDRFYNSLTEGGWFVIGHSEHSLDIYRRFRIRNFPDAILYQRSAEPATPAPASPALSKEPAATPYRPALGPSTLANLAPVPPASTSPTAAPASNTGVSTSPAASIQPLSGSTSTPAASIQFGAGSTSTPAASTQFGAGSTSTPAASTQFGAGSTSTPAAQTGLSKNGSRNDDSILAVAQPNVPQANDFETAQTLMSFGHVDQARDLLLRWLADHPGDAPGCALLGKAYANLGNWPDAERWCKMAIAHDRLNLEAYYTLALVFQHQGQRDQAIEMMKKVVYIDRGDILGHFSLADLFHSSGQDNLALKFLENTRRLLEARPINDLVPRSGDITVGRLGQTIIELQQTWGIKPPDSAASAAPSSAAKVTGPASGTTAGAAAPNPPTKS